MVHTRHSRDVEVDSPPRFLSLEDKRSRKSRSLAADANEQDSDHSGIVYENKDHSIFEEKVVESRLRPRTGPRRAYNYVYADSSDDEMMSRHRRERILTEGPFKVSRHSKQHRIAQEPSSDEEEDIGQARSRHWCDNTRRRRGRPPHIHKQINHHDSQKREQRAGEGVGLDVDDEEDVDDDDEDDNNSALRRSSRLRQKPYRFRPANADESEKEDNTDGLDREKRRRSDPNNSHEEFDDMYSRVKRARTRKTVDQRHEQSASNSDGTNDDKNDSEDENQQQRRSYSLREHKPRTQLYIAPAIEAIKKKPKAQSLFRETPPRRVHKKAGSYRSPAHRKIDFSRKRQAFHGSSSSTSSDPSDSGTETSDEQRFNRRKAKSMAKSRSRICPLNFTADMVSSAGVLKDRVRTGASLADVDPMEIDRSVTFASVGGLQKHIMALKEMVVFPLLYPEFYEHFKVAPSRGVLFYGPPGTGKTLVARALANECSRGTQKVAFFMRKGADCLSKWVGEAERQLRLLFDKAYEMRPSIIFFDEIDGLAPVRSSRQDQIHSSIVSTLLALMDGIDSRGEIVVIGATNRIDSIDPALRRPGRFDREFHFPLPNLEDRKKILKIHTKNWNPSLRDDFLLELAEKCSGYCGADVKSLVTEASQNALRRHYPQIYTTSDKLQLDISSITLTARDFAQAINTIVPAAQRAVPNPALALEESIRPLLTQPLNQLQALLAARFPYAKLTCRDGSSVAQQDGNGSEGAQQWVPDVELASDEEDNMPSIFLPYMRGNKSHSVQPPNASSFLRFSSGSSSFPVVFRPRMLVSGSVGQGQTVHLAPAALHLMEHMPVHTLSSATLFAASAKMPEEACSHVFHEAMRTAPSIIYMPYINELWGVVSDSLRVTFLTLIRSMSPSTPVLLMATSEAAYRDLDEQLRTLFSMSGGEVLEVKSPAAEERRQYFTELILHQTIRPPPTRKQAATQDAICFFTQPSEQRIKVRESSPSFSMREFCHTAGVEAPRHTSNPRSKQTVVSTGYGVKAGDVQGSGGEGSMRQGLVAGCVSRRRSVDSTGKRQGHNSTSVRRRSALSSSRITNISTSRVPATPPSSKAKQLVFRMTPVTCSQTMALRNKSTGQWSSPGSVSKSSTRSKGLKCNASSRSTASKGTKVLRRNNLNYNHSASNCVIAPVHRAPIMPMKLYPCLKSPYHKTLASQDWLGIFEDWLLSSGSPDMLNPGARRVLQPLAKAAAPEPRRLTEREQRKLIEQEEDTLRELRIFLRDILSKLGREKKFYIFTKPVDIEEVPDYYEIIKNPMDLSTMMANIDLHKYNTASAFLDDIFLICSNALEYNPDHGPTDRAIRHRACSMRDMAQALLKAELDPEFEKLCQEITESRKRRGVDSSKSAPAFYHTRPLTSGSVVLQAGDMLTPNQPQTIPEGCRYSRRVRGLEADRTLPLEAVERTTQVEKTLLRKTDKDSPEMEMSSAAEETLAADASAQSKHAEAGENKRGEGAGDQALEVSNGTDPTSPKEDYDRAPDCKCPGSKDPSPSHSGKSPKGSSSDSKNLAAKRASIRKKCPWLATRRRRRILHPTSPIRRPPSSSFRPSHPQSPSKEGHHHRIGVGGDRRNCQTDVEERFRVETMEPQRSPSAASKRGSDGWDDGAASSHRSRREYSPVSAANPANVSARIVRRNAAGVEDSALLPPITSATTTAASGAAAVSHEEEPGSLRQRKASETSPTEGDRTTKMVRSLDVELMVVTDSGVSSESNGDSRDSLDHNNSNRTNTAGENESRLPVNGEDVAASTSSGPSVRTRTRTQNPLHMNALAELEVETRSVEVDKEQLAHLLDTTVNRTQGFSVERLQQLYSVLSCAIFSHRLHFNKMPLIQEMEDTLDRFCRETEEY